MERSPSTSQILPGAGTIAARTLVLRRNLTQPGPLRKVFFGIASFLTTCTLAICGYMLAGWSFLDALYMVVITVFGVGYGETQPVNTPLLRLFTIGVIIAGSISVVYTVGGFVQLLTEGELRQVLETQRMTREISELEGHTIICGFGRMGQILAEKLKDAGQSFVVVDADDERISDAVALGYLVFNGNATDEFALEAAGIGRAKVLATVLPDDASNVYITLTARGMNPDLIILARGEFPTTEKKLKLAGADHVVLPPTIGALRMAHLITHPASLDFLDRNDGSSTINELLANLNLRMDELTIPANSGLAGRAVEDIEVRGRGMFVVTALRRATGEILNPLEGTEILEVGDTLIVVGHRRDLPQFARHFALKRQMQYRGNRTR